MKATVDIPEATYRVLEGKAAAEGKTIKDLVLRGVSQVLSEGETAPPKRRLKLPLIDSKEPGSLNIDNEQIYDLIGFP